MTNAPKLDNFDVAYTYPWQYGLTLTIRRWTYYPEDGGEAEKWAWSVVYEDKTVTERGYGDVMFGDTPGFDSLEDAWRDMDANLLPPESYRAAVQVFGDRIVQVDHVSTDSLVSVSEAAKMLNVTPPRIRALINSGKLVAYKPRGRWMVERRSIDERLSALREMIERD